MLITKAWAIPEQILGSNNRWEYQTHLSRPLTPHQRTVHSPTGWPREKQGQTLDQKWWTTSPLPLRLLHAPLCKEDQPTENRPHSSVFSTNAPLHPCIQHALSENRLFSRHCARCWIYKDDETQSLLSGCASDAGGGVDRNISTANYQRWREKKPHGAE